MQAVPLKVGFFTQVVVTLILVVLWGALAAFLAAGVLVIWTFYSVALFLKWICALQEIRRRARRIGLDSPGRQRFLRHDDEDPLREHEAH